MTTTSVATLPIVTSAPIDTLRLRVLQVVFVVSGFCGLIYESIWSHYLKLFVGHAAYAQTVVLIVFIGGMALGAWFAGRFAGRVVNPLWAYAAVELVVGLISLVFHRLFVRVTDWAYLSLLPAACTPESACLTQWAVAALMILPQSVLLGMTFPLMTSGVLRIARDAPGARIALFYFLNSFGAVVGVLASGFWLIPTLGLPGALLTAGLCNIVLAVVVYGVGKGADARPLAATENAASVRRAHPLLVSMLLIAALTGLSSFVYEIIWIRMLVLVVGASTQAFELMLAAFILGLALGGLWVRKHVDRFRDLVGSLAIVQVLMGLAALATLPVYESTFDFLGWLIRSLGRSEGGYALYNVASQGIAMAVMLPATFLAGMTLPLITTALLRTSLGERAIGYVYAANTLGAIVGVALAVHFALPALGLKHGLMLGALIDIVLGAALMLTGRTYLTRRSIAFWCGLGVIGLAITQFLASVPVERTAAGVFRHGVARVDPSTQFLFHVDGKTATVTVSETPAHISIKTNGKPDASVSRNPAKPVTDEYTMVLTGLLPLAWHPGARTAAVVGFGSGITTSTLLRSPQLERVDTIEIEPQMVEGARHFGAIVEPAYKDPRSHIVIDDAKSYFARSRHKYDLILSEPSNPWVSGVASLFTVEWYQQVHRQLSDEGLLIQWLQIYEFSDALTATILRALDSVFADYAVYAANDADLVIVASKTKLPARPASTFTTWPALRPELQRLQFGSVDEIEARRLASRSTIRPFLAAMGPGVNSDFFPIVDHAAPKARFVRGNADMIARAALAPVPIVEMLEGHDPFATPLDLAPRVAPGPRREQYPAARASIEFMLDGRSPDGIPLPRDIGLVRAALWDCAALPANVRLDLEIVALAGAVNPYVRPDEARRLWSGVRNAGCAHRLSAQDLRWLELVTAVGDRNADSMASIGRELAMQTDLPSFLRRYALLAGATGLVAQKRAAEADALLRGALPKLSEAERRSAGLAMVVTVAADRMTEQLR